MFFLKKSKSTVDNNNQYNMSINVEQKINIILLCIQHSRFKPSCLNTCVHVVPTYMFGWHVHNVTFTGGGTIDANGHPFWKCARDLQQFPCNNHGRPHLMMISNATNIELTNLTIRNSPDWTLHMSSVDNLLVKNMHVINPSDAPNSDGIDLDCVQNAMVIDSIFSVGDDALCVKSGIDYFGRVYGRPSANILFRNITIGKGHGISIGSETSGGVSNVTFDTIAMQGTNSGPRIKSERGRGGVVSGITFQNIQAKDLTEMISMTLNYHKGLAPTNATATPVLRDVMLRNITFVSGESAGLIDGLPESHIRNVTLMNVVFPPHVKFSLCDYVDQGTCEGTTNQPLLLPRFDRCWHGVAQSWWCVQKKPVEFEVLRSGTFFTFLL